MRAFRPEVEFAFDAPLTPEKVLMQLHADWVEELTNGRAKVSNQPKVDAETKLAG